MISEHTSRLLSVRSSGARSDGRFFPVRAFVNKRVGNSSRTEERRRRREHYTRTCSLSSIEVGYLFLYLSAVFALDYSFHKDTAPFFIFHNLMNVFLTWSRFWDIIRSWTEGPRRIRGGCSPVLVCLPWPRKLLPRLRVVDKTVRPNSKKILNPEAYHGEHRKNKEKYISIKSR